MLNTILLVIGLLALIESLIILLFTSQVRKMLRKISKQTLKEIAIIELLIALSLIIISII
ncbi:MAG: hypothetical protein ACP5D2_00705 [Candidatus Nanoarchaeia archaeon]